MVRVGLAQRLISTIGLGLLLWTLVLTAPASFAEDMAAVSGATLIERTLLDRTNTDRALAGLPALEFDGATLEAARTRAADQSQLATLSHYDSSRVLK